VPVEVRENLLDDLRISDAGDDLHRTSAVLTDLDVDLERALEAASSGHGAVLIRFCDSNGGPSRPFPLKVRRLNFTLARHSPPTHSCAPPLTGILRAGYFSCTALSAPGRARRRQSHEILRRSGPTMPWQAVA